MRIAFIGLGNMGAPMATNLLKAGHDVVVFDLVDSAIQALKAAGASAAASAAEATRGVDVVISMLPAGAHVRGLYLGEDDRPGLLDALDGKPLLIDASTIAPDDARAVGEAARERGLDYAVDWTTLKLTDHPLHAIVTKDPFDTSSAAVDRLFERIP